MIAPLRRWFQIHWFTMFILLSGAGGLAWLNLNDYHTPTFRTGSTLGWPWIVDATPAWGVQGADFDFSAWRLGLNIVVALALLWLLALAAEFCIRRNRRAPLLPPRRWFRLHLSSALAATFTAAVLFWVNFTPLAAPATHEVRFDSQSYGWPEIAAHVAPNRTLDGFGVSSYTRLLKPDALAADLTVAVLLVLAVIIICEALIRRRAKAS